MTEEIPSGFRALRWEPTNEQEVVMLFGRLLGYLKRHLAIEFVQTGFPDCKATDSETGDEIWIEFELYAGHFKRKPRRSGAAHARRVVERQCVGLFGEDLARENKMKTAPLRRDIVPIVVVPPRKRRSTDVCTPRS